MYIYLNPICSTCLLVVHIFKKRNPRFLSAFFNAYFSWLQYWLPQLLPGPALQSHQQNRGGSYGNGHVGQGAVEPEK